MLVRVGARGVNGEGVDRRAAPTCARACGVSVSAALLEAAATSSRKEDDPWNGQERTCPLRTRGGGRGVIERGAFIIKKLPSQKAAMPSERVTTAQALIIRGEGSIQGVGPLLEWNALRCTVLGSWRLTSARRPPMGKWVAEPDTRPNAGRVVFKLAERSMEATNPFVSSEKRENDCGDPVQKASSASCACLRDRQSSTEKVRVTVPWYSNTPTYCLLMDSNHAHHVFAVIPHECTALGCKRKDWRAPSLRLRGVPQLWEILVDVESVMARFSRSRSPNISKMQ